MASKDQADTARAAIYARPEREANPQGKLSPDERAVGEPCLLHAAEAQVQLFVPASKAARCSASVNAVMA
jgi:hypothetical protein